jgi:hypothetical protein
LAERKLSATKKRSNITKTQTLAIVVIIKEFKGMLQDQSIVGYSRDNNLRQVGGPAQSSRIFNSESSGNTPHRLARREAKNPKVKVAILAMTVFSPLAQRFDQSTTAAEDHLNHYHVNSLDRWSEMVISDDATPSTDVW